MRVNKFKEKTMEHFIKNVNDVCERCGKDNCNTDIDHNCVECHNEIEEIKNRWPDGE